MARSGTENSKSNAWAWPVGILMGLAIGIPLFGSTGGVAFGVAIGVAFAVALGATRNRAEGPAADGDPKGDASSSETTPADPSIQDNSDGSAIGDDADGSHRA